MSLQQELYKEEARFVPRLRRAFWKARLRAQERVALVQLAEALASKNATRALAACGAEELEKSFEPFGAIVNDTFVKGGKVGGRFL